MVPPRVRRCCMHPLRSPEPVGRSSRRRPSPSSARADTRRRHGRARWPRRMPPGTMNPCGQRPPRRRPIRRADCGHGSSDGREQRSSDETEAPKNAGNTVDLDLRGTLCCLLGMQPPRLPLGDCDEPGAPAAVAVRLAVDEFHPREVARVVNDVGRRVDEPLGRARGRAVVAPEQLSLVAEQPRSSWWGSSDPPPALFGT
jgi:hypothetical protein